MISMPIIYSLCMILFGIGLYGIVTKKNVVKIILSIIIMENALNLFILLIGYRQDGLAPIMLRTLDTARFSEMAVDPLAQAMVLTSIVIGLSIVALMVAMAIRIYERFGTFDISQINDLKR